MTQWSDFLNEENRKALENYQKLIKKYLLVRNLYNITKPFTPVFWHYSDLLNKYSKLLDEA